MKSQTYNLSNPFVPCSAKIFLDEKGMAYTYCVRERGHQGEHNIKDEEPVAEKKEP